MLKKAITLGIIMVLASSLMADFISDFQDAQKLLSQKKNVEAKEAFVKLSETAPNTLIKSKCLAYAATALSNDKKYDEALELAKTISDKPISINCQMEIYLADRDSGKLKDCIEAFKGEDIAAWPDSIDYKGFWNRGQARYYTKNYEDAAKDLNLAAQNAGSDTLIKVQALHLLGSTYITLKDEQKALDAYKQVISLNYDKGSWLQIDSVIKAAKILTKQAKYDEAIKTLELNDKISTGVWGFQNFEAWGDIYKAQGKEKEANEKYDAALALDGVHSGWLKNLKEKRGLSSDRKGND
ncbi:MAG: tetratricopeptide repeat protein [Lentisphaerota bacterium]